MKKRRPMTVRRETRRELILRLVILGWPAQKIARRLGCSSRTVRDVIASPESQTAVVELQREFLTRLDQKIVRLLDTAVKALFRLLRHPNWQAVDAGIQKAFTFHQRYLDRVDITGTLTAHAPVGPASYDGLSREQRERARELLRALKPAPSPLPSRFPPGQAPGNTATS